MNEIHRQVEVLALPMSEKAPPISDI